MACDLCIMHIRHAPAQLISLFLCGLPYPEFDITLCSFKEVLFRCFVVTSYCRTYLQTSVTLTGVSVQVCMQESRIQQDWDGAS